MHIYKIFHGSSIINKAVDYYLFQLCMHFFPTMLANLGKSASSSIEAFCCLLSSYVNEGEESVAAAKDYGKVTEELEQQAGRQTDRLGRRTEVGGARG